MASSVGLKMIQEKLRLDYTVLDTVAVLFSDLRITELLL